MDKRERTIRDYIRSIRYIEAKRVAARSQLERDAYAWQLNNEATTLIVALDEIERNERNETNV